MLTKLLKLCYGDVSTYVNVKMTSHSEINFTNTTLIVILNVPSLSPTTFTMIISARSFVVLGMNDALSFFLLSPSYLCQAMGEVAMVSRAFQFLFLQRQSMFWSVWQKSNIMVDHNSTNIISYQQRLLSMPFVPSTLYERATLDGKDVVDNLFFALLFINKYVGM